MPDQDIYPWLQLLDVEAQTQSRRADRKRRRGRPKKLFARKKASLTLTDDEKAVIDEVLQAVAQRFGRSVSRGQLFGFLAFRLQSELLQDGGLALPEEVNSFTTLAKYLDRKAQERTP